MANNNAENSRHFSFLSGRLTERTVVAWPVVQDLCRQGIHDPAKNGAARVVLEYYGSDLLGLLQGIFRYYYQARAWRTLELAGDYTAPALQAIVEALRGAAVPLEYFENLTLHVPSFAHDKDSLENLARLIRHAKHVVVQCPHFFHANQGIQDWEFFWNTLRSHLRGKRPTLNLIVSLDKTPSIDYFDRLCTLFSRKRSRRPLLSEFRVLDSRNEIRFEFLPEILVHLCVGPSFSWVFQNPKASLPLPHRNVLDQSRKALQENTTLRRLEFAGLAIPGFVRTFERVYLDAVTHRPPPMADTPQAAIEQIRVTGVDLSELLIRRLPTLPGVKTVTCTWLPDAKDILAEALDLKDEVGIQQTVEPIMVRFHNDFSVSVMQRATARQEIADVFRLNNLLVKAQQMDDTNPKALYHMLVCLHTYDAAEFPAISPVVKKLLKLQVELWCEEGWDFHDILDKTARLKQEAEELASKKQKRLKSTSHQSSRQLSVRSSNHSARSLYSSSSHTGLSSRGGPRPGRGHGARGRGRGRGRIGPGRGRGRGRSAASRRTHSAERTLERGHSNGREAPPRRSQSAERTLERGHSRRGRSRSAHGTGSFRSLSSDRTLNSKISRTGRSSRSLSRSHRYVDEEIARTRLLKEKFALFKEMKETLTEEEIMAIEPGLARFCKVRPKAAGSQQESTKDEIVAAVLPIVHQPATAASASTAQTEQKTVRVIRRTVIRTRPKDDGTISKSVRQDATVAPPDDDATIISSNVAHESEDVDAIKASDRAWDREPVDADADAKFVADYDEEGQETEPDLANEDDVENDWFTQEADGHSSDQMGSFLDDSSGGDESSDERYDHTLDTDQYAEGDGDSGSEAEGSQESAGEYHGDASYDHDEHEFEEYHADEKVDNDESGSFSGDDVEEDEYSDGVQANGESYSEEEGMDDLEDGAVHDEIGDEDELSDEGSDEHVHDDYMHREADEGSSSSDDDSGGGVERENELFQAYSLPKYDVNAEPEEFDDVSYEEVEEDHDEDAFLENGSDSPDANEDEVDECDLSGNGNDGHSGHGREEHVAHHVSSSGGRSKKPKDAAGNTSDDSSSSFDQYAVEPQPEIFWGGGPGIPGVEDTEESKSSEQRGGNYDVESSGSSFLDFHDSEVGKWEPVPM